MADKPTIGRVIHYVAQGHSLGTSSSTCRAAIVTDIKPDGSISCVMFSGKGMAFYDNLAQDEGKASGTWHWPEREDVPTSSMAPVKKRGDSPPTPEATARA